MNVEFRKMSQKILAELFQQRLNLTIKINGDDYPEKDMDIKCVVVEMDKVIQSILDYLKYF